MSDEPVYVIEGTDGSGKASHVELLAKWLKEEGHEVAVFDFPQYGHPSAGLVEAYLNGAFGETADCLSPREAAVAYAFDRQIATRTMRAELARGKVVLCNRYQAASKAHQGTKLPTQADRLKYYQWLDRLEFELLGVVPPRKTFVLRMPTEIAQKFVDQKAARAHLGGKKRDLHEADLDHLLSAAQCYEELCALFPDDYVPIDCVDQQGNLESIEVINRRIRTALRPLLP